MPNNENKRYTIYIELDQFPDPRRYPNGIAYRSGIIDTDTGKELDSQGDIATYDEARDLLLSAISRLI